MSPTTLHLLRRALERARERTDHPHLALESTFLLALVWAFAHGLLLRGSDLWRALLAVVGAGSVAIVASVIEGVLEGLGGRPTRARFRLAWLLAGALVAFYVALHAPAVGAVVGVAAPLCLLLVERRARARSAVALAALELPLAVLDEAATLEVRDDRVLNHVNRALRDRAEIVSVLREATALTGGARCGFDAAALALAVDDALLSVLRHARVAEALAQRRHSGVDEERRAAALALSALREQVKALRRAAAAASALVGACAHELSGSETPLDGHSARLEALAAAWREVSV